MSRGRRPRWMRRAAAAMATAGGLVALAPGAVAAATTDPPPAPPAPPAQPPPCPAGATADPQCRVQQVVDTVQLLPAALGLPALGGRSEKASSPQPAPAPVSASPRAPDPMVAKALSEFPDEPFLQSLIAILGQRRHDGTDLAHFAPGSAVDVAAPAPRDVLGPAPESLGPLMSPVRRAPSDDPFPWPVLAPAVLIAGAATGRATYRRITRAQWSWSSPTRWVRYSTVAGAAAGVTFASVGTAFAIRPVSNPVPRAVTLPAPAVVASVGLSREHLDPPAAPTPVWDQLVSLELRLLEEDSRLAAVESELREIVGAASDPSGSDAWIARAARVARLVAEHESRTAAYRDCLEVEYGLYQNAAALSAERVQLLRGAAATAGGAATDAVTYNLLVADTQAREELEIAKAEAMLTREGSRAAARLSALTRSLTRPQAFMAPELAPLSQAFGPTDFALEPARRYQGVFYPHFHTGIDLAAPLDAPIRSTADGVVLVAGSSVDSRGHYVGYGNYVLIAHPDGFESLYGHLDRTLVRPGATVRQGQIIGLEGSTGWSTGPHVHFEIRRDHEVVDPLPLVNMR